MEYLSHSPEETKDIAAQLARSLTGGEVIELDGELGAGKTTFVQGFAQALGYVDPVRSPTFSIMNVYPVHHGEIRQIVHLDFYRIEDDRDVQALGLEEWLGRKDTIVLMEWPRGSTYTDQSHTMVVVQLKSEGEQDREISISRC